MKKLSEYLDEKKVSGRAFAAMVGVDPSIVSRLRRNEMQPSLSLAVAIERATDGAVLATSWVPATPTQSTEDAA